MNVKKNWIHFQNERNLGPFQVYSNFNFDLTLLESRLYPTVLKETKECGLAYDTMDCHIRIMATAAPFCC